MQNLRLYSIFLKLYIPRHGFQNKKHVWTVQVVFYQQQIVTTTFFLKIYVLFRAVIFFDTEIQAVTLEKYI